MFHQAFGRTAPGNELDRWSNAVTDLRTLHNVTSGEAMSSPALWRDIAHAFFNTKEFIYLR